jgi:hypothetical protein
MKPNPPCLASFRRLIDLEISEERRRLPLEDPEAGDCHPANLQLGALAQPELEHRAPGADVRAHYDLHFGGIGQNATRRFSSHLPAVNLVLHPLVAGHESLHRGHVSSLGGADLLGPLRLEGGVAHDRRRHDKGGVRLVDIALRELGEAPPGPVPD